MNHLGQALNDFTERVPKKKRDFLRRRYLDEPLENELLENERLNGTLHDW